MPRGLGFATPTTSAAFFPHWEQTQTRRKRRKRRWPTREARQGLGFDVTRGAAHAAHPHQELPETIVELFDVSEHPHPRMVRMAEPMRPCSAGERLGLYGESAPARGGGLGSRSHRTDCRGNVELAFTADRDGKRDIEDRPVVVEELQRPGCTFTHHYLHIGARRLRNHLHDVACSRLHRPKTNGHICFPLVSQPTTAPWPPGLLRRSGGISEKFNCSSLSIRNQSQRSL